MVYIDSMNAKYGRMKLCHMLADTSEELKEMALKIGHNLRWIHHQGTYKEHFDVCLEKKAKALKLGAKEVSRREIGELLLKKKNVV